MTPDQIRAEFKRVRGLLIELARLLAPALGLPAGSVGELRRALELVLTTKGPSDALDQARELAARHAESLRRERARVLAEGWELVERAGPDRRRELEPILRSSHLLEQAIAILDCVDQPIRPEHLPSTN